ncbi:LysR family transcriptional regulator [Alphaproteobacteria bacterium GH1-50]|uniref:LysR family transcriptional regulator n=1 Tax=Kangsaoukella pontilimi TaxID=2691042 RepID=A0A7C9MKD2_9RHOB|nr:hydrogen peroxide-inducible genes activator [Kangsaoukella pontilimi]MXQ08415.1 LysR family transcriptional regulator [Kangsaoukella pontilimi]
MKNLTLRQMRYVDALARLGHFGRAAEACAISQPALSVQIREVETALGARLFERGARQVSLTRLGRDFVERAQDILRAVDELGDLVRASSDTLDGELRLGVIPTIAPYLLPRILAGASAAYPQLNLNIRETITPRLIDDLRDNRLDAAIVALPVSEPSLSELPLFDEEMLLVRPAEAAGTPAPRASELGDHRLLLLEEGHCFRDQALSFCKIGPGGTQDGLDGSSLSTLVQMVGARMGVTLVPEMAVPMETARAPVAVDRLSGPCPSRTVGMIWRRQSPIARQLEEFAAVVSEAHRDSRGGPEGDQAMS